MPVSPSKDTEAVRFFDIGGRYYVESVIIEERIGPLYQSISYDYQDHLDENLPKN